MSRGPTLAMCCLAALTGARAASAAEPPPQAVVQRGDGGEMSVVIRGYVDIAAPPDRVWRLMSDCRMAPRLVRFVKACRVIEAAPDGAWDVRETHIDFGWGSPRFNSVFRSEYSQGRSVRFRCLPQGELKLCEGEWRIEPHADGRTVRAIYENRLTPPFRAPPSLMRTLLRGDVRASLEALRRTATRQTDAP